VSMERLDIEAHGFCPVCSTVISPARRLEKTEILSCPDCRSLLVFEGLEGGRLRFSEAPQIEEDWGE
jgi:lysine biosynthesis protein LysW